MLQTQRLPFLFSMIIMLGSFSSNTMAQSGDRTLGPPTLGEETKGVPAVPETQAEAANEEATEQAPKQEEKKQKSALSALGTTKITESRRENGQIYRIELEHSSGSKQYIEELDSDGKIGSTSNDIEETPNLPKWRIGSW